MGHEWWEGFKALVNWIFVPIIAAGWWMVKKHVVKLEELEKRTSDNEKSIAVIESQMKDLKDDIEEIKKGINKLLDRLL